MTKQRDLIFAAMSSEGFKSSTTNYVNQTSLPKIGPMKGKLAMTRTDFRNGDDEVVINVDEYR